MYKTNEGGIKNVAVSNDIKNENTSVSVSEEKYKNQPVGYNFFGEPVHGKGRLADSVPGYYDANEIPHPEYQESNHDIDGNGFDLHYPIIERYHIPKGTILIRFGSEYGRFLSTENANFDNLAIGLDIRSIPYREYMVITDDFYVTKGIVGDQPGFGMHGQGGAIQYKTYYPVSDLVNAGILQET